MDEHPDNLTQARRAHSAQDWTTAASHFDAVAADRLTADDLAAYADAVWWLGRIEDNLRLNAVACDTFLAESRPVEAASSPASICSSRGPPRCSESSIWLGPTSHRAWAGSAAPDVS